MASLIFSHQMQIVLALELYKHLFVVKSVFVGTSLLKYLIAFICQCLMASKATASNHVTILLHFSQPQFQVTILIFNSHTLFSNYKIFTGMLYGVVYDVHDCEGVATTVDLNDIVPSTCIGNMRMSCEETPVALVEEWLVHRSFSVDHYRYVLILKPMFVLHLPTPPYNVVCCIIHRPSIEMWLPTTPTTGVPDCSPSLHPHFIMSYHPDCALFENSMTVFMFDLLLRIVINHVSFFVSVGSAYRLLRGR